jgi:hypothetical protein
MILPIQAKPVVRNGVNMARKDQIKKKPGLQIRAPLGVLQKLTYADVIIYVARESGGKLRVIAPPQVVIEKRDSLDKSP